MNISENIDKIRAVFGNEFCPYCNSEMEDEPKSEFWLALGP